MCRLRESNTRPPRYEGGALPSELSRRKIDKWPAAALPQSKATLQQGLPLRAKRGAAGQFWTFTMSNSKASTFAETMSFGVELRMHVTFTRTSASRRALHATCGIADIDRQHACARASGCGRCATREGENLCLRELCRTIWSLLPELAEGCGPPPVSPVFSNPIRVASLLIGNRHSSHTRSRNRSTDNPVGRWRR
jgi:hypothetical protein